MGCLVQGLLGLAGSMNIVNRRTVSGAIRAVSREKNSDVRMEYPLPDTTA